MPHLRFSAAALVAAACWSLLAQADDTGVHVALDTSAGSIEVEVLPQRAPLSACDFLAYVDAKLYDGAAFYRVVRADNDHGKPQIEVIQGGLPEGARTRPPVAHETTELTGLRHVDGTLSLARGPVGTGSAAAFFIVIGSQPSLDFAGMRNPDRQGFAAFGNVVRGMDVVRRIQAMPTDVSHGDAYTKGQVLRDPVVIKRARRVPGVDKPQTCARGERLR